MRSIYVDGLIEMKNCIESAYCFYAFTAFVSGCMDTF